MLYILFLVFSIAPNEVFTSTSEFNLLEQDYYDIDRIESIFQQFIRKYNKIYTKHEYFERLNAFKENLIDINKWNEETPGIYGENEYTDLTHDEFSAKYLSPVTDIASIQEQLKKHPDIKPMSNVEVADNVDNLDWRDYGYVSSVKSQLNCNSGYAFSAVGHLESNYAKKHNKTVQSFSAQQLIDCQYKNDVNDGCYEGNPMFSILLATHGLMTEEDYPYTANKGPCMFNESKSILKVKYALFSVNNTEDDLKRSVTKFGPFTTAMYFTKSMRHIKKGVVYKPVDCPTKKIINHHVLVVGYGRDNNDDYWIIKNSWGTNWADKGYMRLIRGSKACNIGLFNSGAILRNTKHDS